MELIVHIPKGSRRKGSKVVYSTLCEDADDTCTQTIEKVTCIVCLSLQKDKMFNKVLEIDARIELLKHTHM